jgi:hypothetical protein
MRSIILFTACAIKKKEAIMSWINKTLPPLCTALSLCIAGLAAAETIVVKSSGPSAKSFPPGKSIPDNSKVTLAKLDIVTILDGRGTRVLKGPGIFSTTASTATGSSIGSLLRNTGTRQMRTGAVRTMGAASISKPPNVWLIDTSKSGTVCVSGSEAISLWTPSNEKPSNLKLTRVADGKSATVTLRPMQSIKAWPAADLPITNDGTFKATVDGQANPVTLKFVTLGPNPQGLEATASALIKAGCNGQLDLLIETVAVPNSDENGGG